MEERVVGGKDKKYVLYTVVGEEKGRAGVGVWAVRIILSTLLLVALAVVPYVSLRLAQVNDRTLVVFQPVPVHNRSINHNKARNNVHLGEVLKSASQIHENYTTTQSPKQNTSVVLTHLKKSTTKGGNTSVVMTIHEADVTLAILEESNATKATDVADLTKQPENVEPRTDVETTTLEIQSQESSSSTPIPVVLVSNDSIATPVPTNQSTTKLNIVTTTTGIVQQPSSNSSTSISMVDVVVTLLNVSSAPLSEVVSTPVPEETTDTTFAKITIKSTATSIKSVTSSPSIENTKAIVPSTSKLISMVVSSSTTPQAPPTPVVSAIYKPLAHKLVYIATTASGNHVGGFAVWKTDKTVTDWSYFYENIPIEYQSHQDNTDHEMRGLLAAIRTWSNKWQDYHVVLRSHHSSIEGSTHPTKMQLDDEIENLSEGHFTYELEWRSRRSDKLVLISYCLARLHRDYDHWYHTFQGHVDALLGKQDWKVAKDQRRAFISETAFSTDPVKDAAAHQNQRDQPLYELLKPSS